MRHSHLGPPTKKTPIQVPNLMLSYTKGLKSATPALVSDVDLVQWQLDTVAGARAGERGRTAAAAARGRRWARVRAPAAAATRASRRCQPRDPSLDAARGAVRARVEAARRALPHGRGLPTPCSIRRALRCSGSCLPTDMCTRPGARHCRIETKHRIHKPVRTRKMIEKRQCQK